MRTFYKRVKLGGGHRMRNMHAYTSARAETVEANIDDPSNARGGKDSLVIFRDHSVEPGMFIVVNKRAFSAKEFHKGTTCVGANLAVIVDPKFEPSDEDRAIAEAYAGLMRGKGPNDGKKPSHAGKG